MDLVAVSGGHSHAAVKALLALNSELSFVVSGKHSHVCVWYTLILLPAPSCVQLVPVQL